MATLQKHKPDTGMAWSTIFPEDVATETRSGLFVKKLLAVSISNFAYLRAMFPEKAFGNKCLEDISIKILREDPSCPAASQVIRWLKGCFEAIDKKYLQTLTVVISGSEDIVSNVIETYTFRFSYKNGEVHSSFSRGDGKVHEYGPTETKKETIRLLRTIIVLTQSLDSLPPECFMAMRLTYYDDVTPNDYEPPGFRPTDSTDIAYKCETITIKVGDIATPFHDLKLRLKTDKKNFSITTQENEGEPNNVDPHATREIDIGGEPMACDPVCQDAVDAAPAPDSMIDFTDTHPVSLDLADVGREYEVRCVCGQNEDYGLFLQCGLCRTWQHGVCYGILTEESKPERHYCYRCFMASAGGGAMGLCPSFSDANNLDQAKEISLWRRTLNICTQMSSLNPRTLGRRFKIDHDIASKLIGRLSDEGVFGRKGKSSKSKKIVDSAALKDLIDRYFKQLHSNQQNHTDDLGHLDFTTNTRCGQEQGQQPVITARSKRKGECVEVDMSCSADESLLTTRASKARKYSLSHTVEL